MKRTKSKASKAAKKAPRPKKAPASAKASKKKKAPRRPKQPLPEGLRYRNQGIIRARVGDILENPKNYRTHPDDQRTSFRATVDEIGWYGYQDVFEHPEYPGKFMLVDGELRKEDLVSQYGEDAVIDVNLTDFNPVEADKALASKDPLAGMAGTEKETLALLLQDIERSGTSEHFGNLMNKVAREEKVALDALNRLEQGGEADDLNNAAELMAQWKTQPGQLWIADGKHRIICGSAEDPEVMTRLLGGAKPRIMVTDPPYGVDYDPKWREEAAEAGHLAFAARRTTEVANDDIADWSEVWKLSPCPVAYVWYGALNSIEALSSLLAARYEFKAQIIWSKPHFPISRGHYTWQHEPCIYCVRKGASAKWKGPADASTVWHVPLDKNIEGGHSTQKPVECMLRAIINHEGDVLDPFVGTGTTIVAAATAKRKSYSIDISPEFIAVTLTRLSALGMECKLEKSDA